MTAIDRITRLAWRAARTENLAERYLIAEKLANLVFRLPPDTPLNQIVYTVLRNHHQRKAVQ